MEILPVRRKKVGAVRGADEGILTGTRSLFGDAKLGKHPTPALL